jgi:hypothetical protein
MSHPTNRPFLVASTRYPDIPRPIAHVLLGVGVFGMGVALALTLPPALTGVALILALLRICWLEDNIKSDLMGAGEMPANHQQPINDRVALMGGERPEAGDPALMATALRGQVQAWSAGCYGAVAILLSVHMGWTPGAALAALLGMIWLGFRRVDRLAVTIVHLRNGRPLPKRELSRTHSWAHSWRMEDERKR